MRVPAFREECHTSTRARRRSVMCTRTYTYTYTCTHLHSRKHTHEHIYSASVYIHIHTEPHKASVMGTVKVVGTPESLTHSRGVVVDLEGQRK